MSPNFWGCRCCKSGRVAYINTDARYVMLSSRTGQTLFPTVSTGVDDQFQWGDVHFLTKDRVALKADTRFQIYERDTMVFSYSMMFGSGWNLAKNATDILVPEFKSGSPSGRFRPFRCDYDGNLILIMTLDSAFASDPSLIAPPFVYNGLTCAIDSTGACYFAGVPFSFSDNNCGLWKVDADGAIEWRIDTRQEPYPGVRPCSYVSVDSSDNVYFIRWFYSGSLLRPVLYKMDADGNELWTMDFDFNPDVYPYGIWGQPLFKQPYIDNDGGWMYISQSEASGVTSYRQIRRYSLETGIKDPDYTPYFWPNIYKVIIDNKSGDIFAVPSVIGGGNMNRYKADDGALVWTHDMSSGVHQSYNFDVWQE